jgi:hypothetical protein
LANYYRPTHAEAAAIFRSPATDRPFIDLSLTSNVAELPVALRKHNTGVTRWGNLVLGIAVDGAIERGVSPERIKEALAVGSLVAEARIIFHYEYPDIDDPASNGFEGRLEAAGDLVHVMGGGIGDQPDAIVAYTKMMDGMYIPRAGRYINVDVPHPVEVGYTYPFRYGDPLPGVNVPEKFIPSLRLGDLEELATSSIPRATLSGDILNLQP